MIRFMFYDLVVEIILSFWIDWIISEEVCFLEVVVEKNGLFNKF